MAYSLPLIFSLLFSTSPFTVGGPLKLIRRVEPGSTYYTLYAIAAVLGSLAFLRFVIPIVVPRWPQWLGLPTSKAHFDGHYLTVTTKGSTTTLATLLYAASAMITGTTELWAIFHGDQPGERRSGTMFIIGLVFVGLSIYLLAHVHHRIIDSFSPEKYSFSYPAKNQNCTRQAHRATRKAGACSTRRGSSPSLPISPQPETLKSSPPSTKPTTAKAHTSTSQSP